ELLLEPAELLLGLLHLSLELGDLLALLDEGLEARGEDDDRGRDEHEHGDREPGQPEVAQPHRGRRRVVPRADPRHAARVDRVAPGAGEPGQDAAKRGNAVAPAYAAASPS